MNRDQLQSSDTLAAFPNTPDNSLCISKSEDIEYLMFHQIPTQYRVREDSRPEQYYIFDAAGKVGVAVRFDMGDPVARYVLYVDAEGPESTDFNDCAAQHIQHAVDNKLTQWIGQSERRKNKAVAEPNINRVLQYYQEGLPMAVVSPDLPTPTDPVAVKKRRIQFKRELDKNLRPIGFGYHQIRYHDTFSYIIYGQPSKKSEQLLKIVATETGKKYGQTNVTFCDLNGQIYNIHTAKPENGTHESYTPYMAWDSETVMASTVSKDILHAIKNYYCMRADFANVETVCDEELAVTSAFAPIQRFVSTSTILRRRNACILYCSECWDEEAQTYHFDLRYNTYF